MVQKQDMAHMQFLAVIKNDSLNKIFVHEIHHLWQSRAMIDSFLLNYGLQGIVAEIMGVILLII